MMRIFFFFFICSWSCSQESVPKGVLSPEKMETVLFDLVRAEEFVDFSSIQDSSYRVFNKRSALYDSISNIHSITKETFQKSWQYYQGRPDLLKKILESLHSKTDVPIIQKDSLIKKRVIKDTVIKDTVKLQ